MAEIKICTGCGKELLATTEYFYKQLRGKYGVCSQCKKCKSKYDEQPENRKRRNGVKRKWRQKPEVKMREVIQRKKLYQNPEVKRKHQNSVLKSVYGVTLDQYDQMFEEQNGVCAICELPEINMRLSVDHNHETGKVRGLLCRNCNRRLEALEDEEFVKQAQKYLIKCNHIQ